MQKFQKAGTGFKVKFLEKTIDVSRDFKLYITSKLNNPHFTPEITARTVLLNFIVTQEGLEDQMTNIVVKIEEPQKDQ
jgi:dynein heavy chain